MSIRVLVIIDLRHVDKMGPDAAILIGLAKLGFDMSVMTYGGSPIADTLRQAGIRLIPFHPKRKFQPEAIRRIRQEVVERGIDILHLHNNPAIINGLIAVRRLPVQVVLYRGFAGNIHWWDPTAYLKFLHPRVDKIVCNAKVVEEVFHRQLFFDRSKTVVINKGHDLAWYADHPVRPIRRELGIPPEALLLINVANNRKMKGIPYLLKALNRLPERALVHLLLIGRDMDDPENLRIIREGGRPDRVHILGFQSDPLGIMAACDAFVLSSIEGESLTNAVTEAIGVGLAPVITDLPGNRGLVLDGEGGLVVPPGDAPALAEAILRLHDHRELIPQYAARARAHYREHFSNQKTVREMAGLYRSLARPGE